MTDTDSNNKFWDYIIVGTGMGGGPFGLKMAQAGFSVLFLEKGISPNSKSSLKGKFAELFLGDTKENLSNAGRFNGIILDVSKSKPKRLTPFIGTGVGGSSALYGAVLERFKETDFKNWPLSYSNFQNYYDEAEKLFRVRTPREFSFAENKVLFNDFKSQGLNPYHLPLANENKVTCTGCQSYLCANGCKNDSGRVCITEAIEKFGASLITQCSVDKVVVKNGKAVGIIANLNNENVHLNGSTIVLAAGALMTPVILQNSGIGDQSNLLGRNLMRHYVDLYALKIKSDPPNLPTKEIGLNDFYTLDNQTYGTVQSFGRFPPAAVVVDQMRKDLVRDFGVGLGFLFDLVKPVIKFVVSKVTSNRLVMTSIIEDVPQFENRVWTQDGKILISYNIDSKDKIKISKMRGLMKILFKNYKILFIKAAEKNEMLAHVCGTCKMGTDPKSSVVDTENRLHGFENIFVVDSSFFPTSAGTNPALTIAANSLRVAEILIAKESVNSIARGKPLANR